MMEKIALEVSVPALGMTFEFLVSSGMQVQAAAQLMNQLVCAEYGLDAGQAAPAVLIDPDNQRSLIPGLCFYEQSVKNGSRLLLV